MKAAIFTITYVMIAALSFAGSPDKQVDNTLPPIRAYEQELRAAKKQYERRVSAAREACLKALQQVQSDITRTGNLDAALAIRAKIQQLEKEMRAAEESERQSAAWISKDATYTLSSTNGFHAPLPSLLNGGNNLHNGEFAFHTDDNKPGQYVLIDLGKPKTINHVYIEFRRNGKAYQDRAKGLTLWLSSGTAAKVTKVWTADQFAQTWDVSVNNATARYLRIGLPDTVCEPLHLAHVKVYGEDE